jgi:prevent-host-death family protein
MLLLYAQDMEVSVTALRAELAAWLDRVRAGEEIIVTDRGTPVARLAPVGSVSLIESLTEQGVLSKPRGPRRVARGAERVHADGSVSDYVSEHRR